MTAAHNRARRWRRSDRERGAALVEFSLVIALFMMILYGLIAFGVAIAFKHSINQAVAEGARSAVGAYSTLPAPTQADHEAAKIAKARQVVIDDLKWVGSKFDPVTDLVVTIDWCNVTQTAPGDPRCITVKVDQDYENRSIVPSAPGLGIIMPNHLGSTAIVEVTV
jgi:Flp pilus assembly protein TadG